MPPSDTTVESEKTSPPKGHPECLLCRDGTYATLTMQGYVGPDYPWDPYCDRCGWAMASVIKAGRQNRDAEIRRLPPPPPGKAAPKVVKPTQKPVKGSKSRRAKEVDVPVPAPVEAPKPPVESPPRMTLAQAMRPTAPKPVPPPAPPPVQVPPTGAKSAKKALLDAVRDVEGGYDLLAMLGMRK